MTRTEELIARSQSGDRDASEILVEENSGLIWSVAKRFLGRGTEADDLYQLGCLGFLKAVEGFDLEYGTQFSTYAVPKIAGEIRRFLRDDGAVKVSRGLKEQAAAIKAARHRLTGALGREPTIQEISRQTGFSPEEIAMAETATAATESIQRETGDEGFSLENILTDTESEEKMVEKIALRQAVERLPEREGMVIRLRYFHSLTQDRVAKVLQVSQVQVSRIEKKALAQLRELLREY
jgi:RNA polymerase sporulation-specific sigma factor